MKPWPAQSTKQSFERIFKVPFTRFWHPLTGLDIVGLDEQVIKAPDGTSTADHVTATHGPEAFALLKSLL